MSEKRRYCGKAFAHGDLTDRGFETVPAGPTISSIVRWRELAIAEREAAHQLRGQQYNLLLDYYED